jgi:ACS family tartrate transporter-like MFS transporter
MIANPLSFVVGGPLAGFILKMEGVAGVHGWQWIFLMEGVPAFLLAFAVLKFLPNWPARAAWLNRDEVNAITARLIDEEPNGKPDLWLALCDTRVIALGIAYATFNASIYGVILWLPQIVQSMGFSNLATGVIVALCFILTIPAMILAGQSSTAKSERSWHVALPWLIAAASLAAASLVQSNAIVLAALGVGLIGMYSPFGPFFSLPSSFLRGTAAAGGIGLIGTFGNVGAFFGPTVIGLLRQGSGGYATGMAAIAFGLFASALIVLAVGRAITFRSAAETMARA